MSRHYVRTRSLYYYYYYYGWCETIWCAIFAWSTRAHVLMQTLPHNHIMLARHLPNAYFPPKNYFIGFIYDTHWRYYFPHSTFNPLLQLRWYVSTTIHIYSSSPMRCSAYSSLHQSAQSKQLVWFSDGRFSAHVDDLFPLKIKMSNQIYIGKFATLLFLWKH